MQALVDKIRAEEQPAVLVVLSHNGMDVDLKLASRVTGIDVIFGGHTHDGMPAPSIVANAGGKTLVTNAGSNGKFLGVMDLDVKDGKVRDFRYRLLPVFSNLLLPNAEMAKHIEEVRAPYRDRLGEKLATTEETLYRRGNSTGPSPTSSSATPCVRPRTPRSAYPRVSAGAPACYLARLSPWTMSWTRPASPIRRPIAGR